MIDVWHIYKCIQCDFTWNINVITRKNISKIDVEQYDLFLQNDPVEARRLEFDYALLSRNRVELCEPPTFQIEGPSLDEIGTFGKVEILIEMEFTFPVRLSNILAKKIGISHRQVASLVEANYIGGIEIKELKRKAAVRHHLTFDLQSIHRELRL